MQKECNAYRFPCNIGDCRTTEPYIMKESIIQPLSYKSSRSLIRSALPTDVNRGGEALQPRLLFLQVKSAGECRSICSVFPFLQDFPKNAQTSLECHWSGRSLPCRQNRNNGRNFDSQRATFIGYHFVFFFYRFALQLLKAALGIGQTVFPYHTVEHRQHICFP